MAEQPNAIVTQKTVILALLVIAIIAGGWKLKTKNKPNNQNLNPARAPAPVSNKPQAKDSQGSSDQTRTAKNTAGKQYNSPPPMQIDQNKKYTAELVTSEGNVTIELFAKETPITVNNFVFLAREGFYKDTIFHRVIKGFMIQGGDPEGTGAGGPGYKFDDEPIRDNYLRGTVAMANAGPNTNGSQFFIIQKDSPHLPKNYVIFGRVVKGMETVDKIANAPVKPNAFGEKSQPIQAASIIAVKIHESK